MSEAMPWEAAVKANITTCKLIILDATKATEHIETELKYISSENLWYKTIIVGTPDAAMVLTEFVETGIRNGACVVRELNDIIDFIEKSRSMLKVPTPTMHISDLYHG